VTWNQNKRQLTAGVAGKNITWTLGNKIAVINNNVKKTMPVVPLQVNGQVMISLSFIATEFGYKLNVKPK
jgi:hypothetical protein